MKVIFNNVEEFCTELEKDTEQVDRRIVRCTKLFKATKLSSNIHHIFAVATYATQGQIVELKRYCGDIWQVNAEEDKKAIDLAEKALKAVEETCQRLGFEVRAGYLEEQGSARKGE
jgi:hypothetical protein